MSSLAAPRANGTEASEIGSGERQLACATSLDERETVSVSDMSDPTPVLDRRGGDADFPGKGLDNLLHAPLFVNLTSASRGMSFGGSTIGSRALPWHPFVMPTKPLDATPTRSEMMQGWARRVRQARLAADLATQEDLESALGMAPKTISTWERGIQMCHPTDMYRLAKLLGVTMDWLVGGDESFLTLDAKRRLMTVAV